MPHYVDGTPAKVGDLVKGKGYNVAGEIVGKVVQVTEAEACNLAVAHIGKDSPVLLNPGNPEVPGVSGHTQMGWGVFVIPSVEYGACKDFMKIASWLIALAVMMAIGSSAEARGRRGWSGAEAQPQTQPTETTHFVDHRDRKVDGSAGYNADLVTDLPQTSDQKLYLTLTTSEPMQTRDAEVALWFARDARLQHFKSQTHFNWYTTANPHYRERLYQSYGGAVPIVTLQRPDGEILLHVTAKSMPRSAGELADMINAAVSVQYAPPDFSHASGMHSPAIIREGDCPDDSCTPPSLGPAQPIPEVVPSPLDTGSGLFILLLVGLVIGGGGLVVVLALIAGAVTFFSFRRQPADDSILPARG